MLRGPCHGHGHGHPQPTMNYHRTTSEHVKKVAEKPACHGSAGAVKHHVVHKESFKKEDYPRHGHNSHHPQPQPYHHVHHGGGGQYHHGACGETGHIAGRHGHGGARRYESFEETCEEEYETYEETSYEVHETCEEEEEVVMVGGGGCAQLRRGYRA